MKKKERRVLQHTRRPTPKPPPNNIIETRETIQIHIHLKSREAKQRFSVTTGPVRNFLLTGPFSGAFLLVGMKGFEPSTP